MALHARGAACTWRCMRVALHDCRGMPCNGHVTVRDVRAAHIALPHLPWRAYCWQAAAAASLCRPRNSSNSCNGCNGSPLLAGGGGGLSLQASLLNAKREPAAAPFALPGLSIWAIRDSPPFATLIFATVPSRDRYTTVTRPLGDR